MVSQITSLTIVYSTVYSGPGARPTNDISIEFEIQPKFAGL